MTTLATLPQYPVPELDCQLSFTLTESGSNFLRVWLTDAPDGSVKKAELDKNSEKRVHFYTGDAKPFTFKPDVGGVYKLLCQEYVKGSGYGGAYEGDPSGAPSETKVGSEATVDLIVGQRVTQQLGYQADTATLVWWVWGAYVRPTTLGTHGEASPAVIEPSSLRAAIAAKDPDVATYAAACANTLVSANVGSITTMAASVFVTKLLAHQVTGGTVHDTMDTLNPMPIGLGSSVGPKNLADVLNLVLSTMRNHYLNIDSTNGTGEGSVGFHLGSGGDPKSDRINYPIVESVGDLAQAYAALGDITRSYEAHRVSTAVHGTADTTNSLMSMPNLVRIHRYFFAALANATPTAPPTVNSGVVTAVSIAGFTES